MLNVIAESLDATFAALAHPVRRDMLVRLRSGPAQVTRLAARYDLSLPSISRHLDVLEEAGLILRTAEGRERVCALQLGALDEAIVWLGEHRRFWEGVLDSLVAHFAKAGSKEQRQGAEKRRRGPANSVKRTTRRPRRE